MTVESGLSKQAREMFRLGPSSLGVQDVHLLSRPIPWIAAARWGTHALSLAPRAARTPIFPFAGVAAAGEKKGLSTCSNR